MPHKSGRKDYPSTKAHPKKMMTKRAMEARMKAEHKAAPKKKKAKK